MIYNISIPNLKNPAIPDEKKWELLYETLLKQNRKLDFILKNIGSENLSEELKKQQNLSSKK